jgi:hypothetical protein
VIADSRFYEPSDRGFEREVAARMAERERATGRGHGSPERRA